MKQFAGTNLKKISHCSWCSSSTAFNLFARRTRQSQKKFSWNTLKVKWFSF